MSKRECYHLVRNTRAYIQYIDVFGRERERERERERGPKKDLESK